MRIFVAVLLLSFSFYGFAQTTGDSIRLLKPILIQAYSSERPLMEVPASIGYLRTQDLYRYNNTSVLPVVNTIPGVRMEERSPGSYRFSIRGSLLRSPFGIRNVKAYWNGLPMTDGGGNTYLNLLDFNAIGSIEIIKGPGGSLYGAGTGGVVLLNSPLIDDGRMEVSFMAGRYGLKRFLISKQIQSEKINARIQYAHQGSDGYREQTEMKRSSLNAEVIFQLNSKNALSATVFYTDLFYETPGGLTFDQYNENPKQARPSGPGRGAVEQEAAVSNKTPFAGLSFDHEWNEHLSTRIGIFGSHSDFDNPTIRNWEVRDERNVGARTETNYRFGKERVKGKLTAGAEFQDFKSSIDVYGNSFGVRDTAQTKDKLTSQLALLFLQTELHLPLNFFLTIGASVNFTEYTFARTHPSTLDERRDLDPFLSPRIALLNKLTPGISLYTSVSRGFSPPSIAELYPSRGVFDRNIQAEQGTNVEVGARGEGPKNSVNFDITAYYFRLKDALVIRRDPDLGDAEYFVNAGTTSQKGIEAFFSSNLIRNKSTFVSDLRIWNSYAYHRYRFENYVQAETDYSGKKVTGVSPTINTSGIDIVLRRKFYLNVTGNYVDHTPLNDANTTFASEYFLLGARAGWKQNISLATIEVFTGVDNALDKKYSLGNDLNAVGGRYYNAAAGINFYAGIKFTILKP